jgi:ABC-type nitrate/sulfonate/bicarbonate transport system permease component
MRHRLALVGVEIWLPIALVSAWWFLTEGSHSPYFPPLRKILISFKDTWLFARFGTDVVPSLIRFFEGFALAIVFGVVLGLLLGLVPLVRQATGPAVDFLRSIPVTGLVSVFIVLLGFGNLMKVSMIAFAAFFPILLNTVDGVRGVSPSQLEMARAYRLRWHDRIFRIVLPAASPQIFAGLRVALSVALLVMAFSEMSAGTNGLGFFIRFTEETYRITEMWAGIVLLGLLGYLVNLGFLAVERRVLRWHRGWRKLNEGA